MVLALARRYIGVIPYMQKSSLWGNRGNVSFLERGPSGRDGRKEAEVWWADLHAPALGSH